MLFVAVIAAANVGCGLVFSTDCFDGTCSPAKDASFGDVLADARADAAVDDAKLDTNPIDAADTAPPSCGTENACTRYKIGANYCGGDASGVPNMGTPGCVYYCPDSGVACSRWCPQGCDVVNSGVDHCHGDLPWQCP